MDVTKTEREQFSSRLALVSGLLGQGEVREAQALLRALRWEVGPRLPLTPEDLLERHCPIRCTDPDLCVLRQRENDANRPRIPGLRFRHERGEFQSDTPRKRGRSRRFPTCANCETGRQVREALTLVRIGR